MSVGSHHHCGPSGSHPSLSAPGRRRLPSHAGGVCHHVPYLFPIDVACGDGDHGGFSHKPREEGAHAQGGSVYPGDENAKAIRLLKLY